MRLKLRLLEPIDLESFYTLIRNNRSQLEAYLPFTSRASQDIRSAENYFEDLLRKQNRKEGYTLLIDLGTKVIGMIYIKSINWSIAKCELGYFIDEDFQGKGYMTKAVQDAVVYCFETLGMHKVFARIGVDNVSSKKVALNCGFELEGGMKDDFRTGEGHLVDVEYYGMIRKYS